MEARGPSAEDDDRLALAIADIAAEAPTMHHPRPWISIEQILALAPKLEVIAPRLKPEPRSALLHHVSSKRDELVAQIEVELDELESITRSVSRSSSRESSPQRQEQPLHESGGRSSPQRLAALRERDMMVRAIEALYAELVAEIAVGAAAVAISLEEAAAQRRLGLDEIANEIVEGAAAVAAIVKGATVIAKLKRDEAEATPNGAPKGGTVRAEGTERLMNAPQAVVSSAAVQRKTIYAKENPTMMTQHATAPAPAPPCKAAAMNSVEEPDVLVSEEVQPRPELRMLNNESCLARTPTHLCSGDAPPALRPPGSPILRSGGAAVHTPPTPLAAHRSPALSRLLTPATQVGSPAGRTPSAFVHYDSSEDSARDAPGTPLKRLSAERATAASAQALHSAAAQRLVRRVAALERTVAATPRERAPSDAPTAVLSAAREHGTRLAAEAAESAEVAGAAVMTAEAGEEAVTEARLEERVRRLEALIKRALDERDAAKRAVRQDGRLAAELQDAHARIAALEGEKASLRRRVGSLHEVAAERLPKERRERVHYADQILAAVNRVKLTD